MRTLAVASLRTRIPAFTAHFLSVFCGAVLIGAFATLVSAAGGDIPDADSQRLITMGAVMGGWGTLIVLFSVASTLTLVIGQRTHESALLRSVGATGQQIRRLVLIEASLVTVTAVLLALVPAGLVGDRILALMRDVGMLSAGVTGHGQLPALLAGSAVIVVVGYLAGRLATRRSPGTSPRRVGRLRVAAGILLVLAGIQASVVTVTVMADDPDPLAPMSTAGPGGVLACLGLAVLSPVLLRLATAGFGWVLRPFGVAGHLARHDLRARAHVLGAALAPITVFAGISTGTVYLVAIENRASAGLVATREAEDVELLNYVVVGMIALFAAIMVVNTLAAAIADRRREFGQQRLAGATGGRSGRP